MKHQHVADTLTYCASDAHPHPRWAALADGDDEPLPKPTRLQLEWDGPSWAEVDWQTGAILARGSLIAANDSPPAPKAHEPAVAGFGPFGPGGEPAVRGGNNIEQGSTT